MVNSLSLKDGEDEFRRRARLVRRYGAAAVVMAFDEQGQADTLERRVSVCRRAWDILTKEVGFPPEDIIFDPNVFAVATGLPEHDRYAVDYIETCRADQGHHAGRAAQRRHQQPVVSRSAATTAVREAMHSVFLYHAIGAGLDMGIVNAGQLAVYEDIDPALLEAVEDVILARRPDAAERLLAVAAATEDTKAAQHETAAWRALPVSRAPGARAAERRRRVRRRRHAGRPAGAGSAAGGHRRSADGGHEPGGRAVRRGQDVPAAGDPLGAGHEARRGGAGPVPAGRQGPTGAHHAGRVLLATVKGDVHDIGKNIVGVVLGCNNYEIIDLGVMVPAERIIATAIERNVDIIGLSGLITPSLGEMVHVAKEMTRQGLTVPLLIGGATTSRVHTAVKIDPHYAPGVVHVQDASRAVGVVGSLISDRTRPDALARVRGEYEKVRTDREAADDARELLSLADARRQALRLDFSAHTPRASARDRRARDREPGSGRVARTHRLDAVLPDLAAERQVPADLRRRARGRRGPPPVRRGPGHAATKWSRTARCAPAASGDCWPAACRRRRSGLLHRRVASDEVDPRAVPATAAARAPATGPTCA